MKATVFRCDCPPTDWHHLPQHCDNRYEVEVEVYVGPEYKITHPAPPEPRPPHPPPEVPARRAEVDEIPRSPKAIMDLARERGWEVTPVYARGTPPTLPHRVVELVVLQIAGEDGYLVAQWENGKFRSAWKLTPDLEHYETLAALKKVIG